MGQTRRVPARQGYDLWAETYDATPNPVVAMDWRHTLPLLAARAGERILDAGCGTGRNLHALEQAGAHAVGIDFSAGMLAVCRRGFAARRLVQADLEGPLPLASGAFDAVLCALIGEHLRDPGIALSEFRRLLRPGGRLVFSVYHPDMAEAGKEANFEQEGVEYRLGAVRHTVDDYRRQAAGAGLDDLRAHEFRAGQGMGRLAGWRVLLVITGRVRG